LCLLPLLLAFVAVGGSAPPASASTPFSITTNPPLTPAFATTTYDYAVRCASHATTTLRSTGAGSVTIGGKSFTQPASVELALTANQAVYVEGDGHAYTIRCLPEDFPSYRSVVDGTPQVHGYLVGLAPTTPNHHTDYVVAFDNHGVPVWWYDSPSAPINAAFYGPDQIGWWLVSNASVGVGNGTYTIRDLTGAVKATIGNPSAGTDLDLHDFQVLPNGDYLGIQYVNATLDLSSWGLSTTQPIINCLIVEINPQGQIVWTWSTIAHIDVAAENANWHSLVPDVIHMNSVQEVGGQIIMSSRALDAVYDIDKATGNIIWKLGGTTTPQSLAVIGNTYPQVFSGQHDARLSDGSITVHDNATQEIGHASRALRFQIETATNTATIVEDVTDANHPEPSNCCGSVDKLKSGDWVIYWGTSNYVTELTPSGSPVIRINFAPYVTYRVAVVPTSDAALSRGMDARYPPLKL